MFWTFVAVYLVVGLLTAVVTVRTFPPMEGFQPKLRVRLLAVSVFAVLWPVLLLLCIWYLGVAHWGRSCDVAPDGRVGVELPAKSMQGMPAPKPR